MAGLIICFKLSGKNFGHLNNSKVILMSYHIEQISPFLLRLVQRTGAAKDAEGSLSVSYAELVDMKTLISLDDGLIDKILSFNGAYPDIFGGQEIRELIGDFVDVDADSIIITNGVDDAILSIYASLLKKNDRITMIQPAYDPLIYNAEAQGATVCGVTLDDTEFGWNMSQKSINQLTASGVRACVLNLPHNPTGWYPGDDELQQIFSCAEKNNCLAIADEVYAGLNYFSKNDNQYFGSLASQSEQVISVGSLTKSFGLPGLRIGWIASKDPKIVELIKHQRTYGLCYTSLLSEIVACSALKNRKKILERNKDIAKKNLDNLDSFVKCWDHVFSYHRPNRGTVCFVKFNPSNTPFSSAPELSADFLKKNHILLISNELFNSSENYFRFGFGNKNFSALLNILEVYLKKTLNYSHC